jgi:hypothetical protein
MDFLRFRSYSPRDLVGFLLALGDHSVRQFFLAMDTSGMPRRKLMK